MPQKLHQSKDWLMLQHHSRKKSIDEIAQMAGVTPLTIRRAFEKFGIKITY